MPRPALSICLIVRNEERHLASCLDSVKHLAAEIIVVDTGSTDSTVAIATRYGAKILTFDFTTVNFAAARNHALAQATGHWILMLDADEILDAGAGPVVDALITQNENVGYFLERHNHSAASVTPLIDYVVRLFPNRPDYRYRGRVHETIDHAIVAGGGRLRQSGIGLVHNFAHDSAERRRKNQWYIQILLEEIAADPSDDSRLDFLAAEYHQLEMFNEATAVAERIVQMRPTDARAHLFAGTYHLLFKPDLKQARADFNTALRLQPGYPEALSFLRLLEEKESGGQR